MIGGTGPGGIADLVAGLRQGIVGVSAGASAGTGYVARANGIVATTHGSVGYQLEAVLHLDDGRTVPARVISVDVARGVAFLLPKSALGVAPLPVASSDALRLGDAVLALGRLRGEPLAIARGIVSSVGSGEGEERAVRMDARVVALGGGGCPVVDGQARVIGLAPAGPAASGVAYEPPSDHAALIIANSYEADLAALDLPPVQLAERGPSYACPSCAEPLRIEVERCLACGVAMPHATATTTTATPIPGERAVKDILATLGVVANKVRVGPRTWRVQRSVPGVSATPGDGRPRRVDVTLQLDDSGQHIVCRVLVARVPSAHHEAFYRLLLTLNDLTSGLYHLSVAGDVVALSFTEIATQLRERDAAALLQDLVKNAEHYRRALADSFGALAPDG